jgi:hypothetical protein
VTSAASTSSGSFVSDDRNAAAVPWKLPCTLGGRRRSRAVRWVAASAAPSAAPGARLNEIVTAGNWPWCVIASGCVAEEMRAIARSGTAAASCRDAGAVALLALLLGESGPVSGASRLVEGVGASSGVAIGAVVPAAAELAAAAAVALLPAPACR